MNDRNDPQTVGPEPTNPAVVDLALLAASLEKHGKLSSLRNQLKALFPVHSCYADIEQAQEYLNDLNEVSSLSETRRNVRSALLQTIVLFYVRATHGGSFPTERSPVRIAKKLNADQKIDHEALIAIRNKAIAHIDQMAGPDFRNWHDEGAAMTAEWQIRLWSMQGHYDAETHARLERMLPIAYTLVKQRLDDLLDNVHLEFDTAKQEDLDPSIYESLRPASEVFGAVASTVLQNTASRQSVRWWDPRSRSTAGEQ